MNLTKAQLNAIGHLTKEQENGTKAYIIRRDKITKVSQPFVSGVITFAEDGAEVGVAPINGRVIAALIKMGLIQAVGGDSVHGTLYEATQALLTNKAVLDKGSLSFGERAKHSTLEDAAFKFGCTVTFDRTPRLFKVERLDGVLFSRPHIDVSKGGIKVTRLTDLSLEEWQDEIAEVIKRSVLI